MAKGNGGISVNPVVSTGAATTVVGGGSVARIVAAGEIARVSGNGGVNQRTNQ